MDQIILLVFKVEAQQGPTCHVSYFLEQAFSRVADFPFTCKMTLLSCRHIRSVSVLFLSGASHSQSTHPCHCHGYVSAMTIHSCLGFRAFVITMSHILDFTILLYSFSQLSLQTSLDNRACYI